MTGEVGAGEVGVIGPAISGALLRERRVELGVVLAVHQQGLGGRVQLHGCRQGHVQFRGQQGLRLGVRQGRALGQAAGQRVGGLVGAALVGELADEADAFGLGGADGFAEHQEAGGVAEADDAGQEVGGAHVAAGEADAGEEEGEAGRGVGHPEVGGEGEDRAGARRHAVHGGDHREGALAYGPDDLPGHPVEVEQLGGVHGEGGADDLVDVAAGAEAAAVAGQYQGPYGLLPGEFGEQVAQVGVGAEGEGVELLGAGEGDGGHTVGDLAPQMPPVGGVGGGAGEGTHDGRPPRGLPRRCGYFPTHRSYHRYLTVVTSAR